MLYAQQLTISNHGSALTLEEHIISIVTVDDKVPFDGEPGQEDLDVLVIDEGKDGLPCEKCVTKRVSATLGPSACQAELHGERHLRLWLREVPGAVYIATGRPVATIAPPPQPAPLHQALDISRRLRSMDEQFMMGTST